MGTYRMHEDHAVVMGTLLQSWKLYCSHEDHALNNLPGNNFFNLRKNARKKKKKLPNFNDFFKSDNRVTGLYGTGMILSDIFPYVCLFFLFLAGAELID